MVATPVEGLRALAWVGGRIAGPLVRTRGSVVVRTGDMVYRLERDEAYSVWDDFG